MRNRSWLRVFLALAFVAGGAAAFGYVARTDDSGVYLVKWQSSPISMQLKLSAASNLSDGNSPRSTVVAAMQIWNAELATVQLSPVLSSPGSYSAGNGTNEIVMDSTMDGDAFPTGVLAITLGYALGDRTTEADIIFNTAYTWNSYRGNLRNGTEDLQRVAVHELGHVLGLDHPDEHGQYIPAIMNSRESNVYTLQSDDIEGGHALYGVPGLTPANDAFANATTIAATEWTYRFTGSNIAATRESGETDHAGSSGVHSVWWKWTPAENTMVEATTLGSNFDTVMAVYTGSSPSALTTVASNDDEETPEQNTTPQRKRTSKVTFSATAGTTYYFAVDGWGSARTVLTGYTGAVVLNLNLTVFVAPAIVAQPEDATVAAGGYAGFVVGLSGRPYPDRTWQRRPAKGTAWEELRQDGTYSMGEAVGPDYRGTSHLSVKTDITMDGDQFRLAAKNVGGTAYSAAATLHVTGIPLPVITAQPKSRKLLTGVSGRLVVQATGADSYQWYRNGALIPGETRTFLLFAEPQAGDAGDYIVVLRNPGGSVTSETAKVTVDPPAVITNTGATRQVIALGETLSLGATVTGTGALSYQWYHNGRPLSGATHSTYSRRVESQADAGAYWVAATDDMGTRHGAPFFVIIARASTNVVAWGANYDHQAEVPLTLRDAVAVAGAPRGALALRQGGSVVAWGNTAGLQLDVANAVAVAAGEYDAVALRADGTVLAASHSAAVPAKLKEVWAVAVSDRYGLALRTDGTVEAWGAERPAVEVMENVVAITPRMALRGDGAVVRLWPGEVFAYPDSEKDNVVAIAGGDSKTLGLKADGTLAWNPSPARQPVTAIAAGAVHALALQADGTVVAWDGSNQYGEIAVPAGLSAVFAIAGGDYASYAIRDTSVPQPLILTSQPRDVSVYRDGSVTLAANAAEGGSGTPTYQWRRNGRDLPGATSRTLTLATVQESDTGIYGVVVSGSSTVASSPVVLAMVLPSYLKKGDMATEVGSNIVHPNGNTFDQILLQGAATAFRADYDAQQITRLSFVDLDDDIVQVELSGPGTVSIVLEGSSGPAAPVNYHQPGILYMKGHAGIVIAGGSYNTHLSVFTVGRATAFDPSGGFDFLRPVSATNQPDRNGSTLFQGHENTAYDGVADIAFIAITNVGGSDGFGGVRTSNVHFFSDHGYTGLYAPRVRFTGPVYVGDITAFGSATPVLDLGWAEGETRITGGDLHQDNGCAVQVSGLTKLQFTDGTDSHGHLLPAQANRAVLRQDGVDVTSQIVVNPPGK